MSVLVAPDPITSVDMLYGGTFLYFDKPIILTIPPQVVTTESFAVFERVRKDRPAWAPLFMGVLSTWSKQKEKSAEILDLLRPLSKIAFISAMLAYNANDAALVRARDFIASAGWTPQRLLSSVNGDNACGELIRHIFLEKFLELNNNLTELYRYLGHVFTANDFEDRMADAYALRMLALFSQGQSKTPIALTNPLLANFLADLPGQNEAESPDADFFEKDAVSMMIFNGLLSNWIDPLSEKHVETLGILRSSKRDEIDRLKGKCLSVADDIDRSRDAETLFSEVDQKVRFNIMPEVRDLLELGDAAFRDYKEKLFSDRVFWTGFIGTVVSTLSGSKLVSAGAAVSTLASMGANAFSHYREIRQTVKKSDYSLIYTVAKL